jgi:serine/threonine protein kinase
MLTLLTKFKNKIRDKLKNRRIVKRRRQYEVVIGSDIMTVNSEAECVLDDLDATSEPPAPSPNNTRTLFRTEINNTIINEDYELQELIRIMDMYKFNIKDTLLEPRYEDAIHSIPDASDIIKIKMRILYIIIANNIYRDVFEEKKLYCSVKSNQYIGVFRYNGYILRIDDSPYSFINETEIINALREFPSSEAETRIIRPFLVYSNIKRNLKNDVCECRRALCDCKYYDDADNYAGMEKLENEPRVFYNKLRENMISFSIQHYVKQTQTLYNWVKDNIGNSIYKQYLTLQNPFFIHLFYQCAILLRDIHVFFVVHGDIKPDNILIREHDNFDINHPEKCKHFTVYLIDFGLSGISGKGYGTGGTIPYCHPEFKNIRDTNRPSKYHWKTIKLKHDVWSLGIAFLTMYIYRDFYNYYHKYPHYVFTSDGYISSLLLDVISNKKLHDLFTKILSIDCIPIENVCELLRGMDGVN